MDSIQVQKLQAMKSYKRAQFLYNLVVYSLTAFLSCLFYLYLFWFPSLSINQLLSVLAPNIYSISPNKVLFILGIVLFLIVSSGSQYSSSPSSPVDEIYEEYVRRSRSIRREMPKKNEGVIHRKKSIKTDQYHATTRVKSIKKKTSKKTEKELVVDNQITDDVGVVHDVVGENHHDHEVDNQNTDDVGVFHEVVGENYHDHDHEVVTSEVEKKLSSTSRVPEEEQDVLPIIVREDDQLRRRVEDFIARVNRQRLLEESFFSR